MPKKVRIPHFEGLQKGFEIRDYPLPDPEPGGAFIQISATSICGTDVHMWKGEMPCRPGGFIGHEMTGRISHLGKGVTKDSLGRPLHDGDRVVFPIFYPCGTCSICKRGDYFACPVRSTRQAAVTEQYQPFIGGFGDYHYLLPGHWVYKVLDELSDDLVAPINCAACVVTHGVGRAVLKPGESVVVQGAGGLGLHTIPIVKEAKAGKVIVVDKFQSRLDLAKRMGADETISFDKFPSKDERVSQVKALTGGWGADVVVDCVGTVPGMEEGIAMTGPAGRYVELGNTIPTHTISLMLSKLLNARVTLFLTGGYNPKNLVDVMEFLARTKKKYPYHELVTKKYPMEQVNEAFRAADWNAAKGGESPVGRILVTP